MIIKKKYDNQNENTATNTSETIITTNNDDKEKTDPKSTKYRPENFL